jgi:HK97 family phage major capsid protein
MADTTGMADIRGLNIDKAVTGFALGEYVFKQLCTEANLSAWNDRYFKETAADLSGGTGNNVKGVPRLAAFPMGEVSWTQVNATAEKYGMETRISWEDARTNDVDVIARSLLRVARAITKAVDAAIWNVITENQNPTTINSVTISAGYEWDSLTIANQNPIQDILNAKKAIYEDNYNPDSNGYLLLNPKDYANLLGNANIRNAGQFYTSDVTRNGNVGFLLGLKVLVSNNVTADKAAVVVGKECATWKSVAPLQTITIEDQGIGYIIRSWEAGVCELRNPEAVCLIINTAK